jgi:hypothetical protein
MRTSPLVLALPALVAADQIPLMDQVKGWFAKASSTVSSNIPSASDIPNPVTAATGKIAEVNVQRLTLDNHKTLLKSSTPGIEDWMIFVTGGNKTCFGMCGRAEEAFNGSVALISASPSAPSLAYLNCETDGVLCSAWAVSPPNVLHMQLPQPLPDQSMPATTVRAINVNRTTITAPEVAAIHLQEKYKDTAVYEGFWHPFDGPLAKAGVNIYAGWAIWAFGQVPSWAFMILVSFVSRNIMSVLSTSLYRVIRANDFTGAVRQPAECLLQIMRQPLVPPHLYGRFVTSVSRVWLKTAIKEA